MRDTHRPGDRLSTPPPTKPAPVAWSTALAERIAGCELCPRLRAHCAEVARVKRRAWRHETYWGRPVAGFGDPDARILLLGLAPAAHGANRTGRMFTGDRSGDFLYAALHRAGFANRATSVRAGDGLALAGVFVTAACRCAPPGNRPESDELRNCARFLDEEFERQVGLRVVVALGRIAWDAALARAARAAGRPSRPRPAFGHGAETASPLGAGGRLLPLVGSYHPSQQNTQTGRLTPAMLDRVIHRAAALASTDVARR